MKSIIYFQHQCYVQSQVLKLLMRKNANLKNKSSTITVVVLPCHILEHSKDRRVNKTQMKWPFLSLLFLISLILLLTDTHTPYHFEIAFPPRVKLLLFSLDCFCLQVFGNVL